MDELDELRAAAGRARMIYLRLADEGGLLQQIETGEWDERLRGSMEIQPLLEVMAERARLDRIALDQFAPVQRA